MATSAAVDLAGASHGRAGQYRRRQCAVPPSTIRHRPERRSSLPRTGSALGCFVFQSPHHQSPPNRRFALTFFGHSHILFRPLVLTNSKVPDQGRRPVPLRTASGAAYSVRPFRAVFLAASSDCRRVVSPWPRTGRSLPTGPLVIPQTLGAPGWKGRRRSDGGTSQPEPGIAPRPATASAAETWFYRVG